MNNVTALVGSSSDAISAATGLSISDLVAFGMSLVKQALGAAFGFIIAAWPLELAITVIILVVYLARRAKNTGGRA